MVSSKKMSEVADSVCEFVEKYGKPAMQYGLIPLIIILGMNTNPRPTLAQLLSPM